MIQEKYRYYKLARIDLYRTLIRMCCFSREIVIVTIIIIMIMIVVVVIIIIIIIIIIVNIIKTLRGVVLTYCDILAVFYTFFENVF